MRQGWDLARPWGFGDVIFFFSKFIQIWYVSYLHEWHMHLAPFFWSRPHWALGRGQKVKYHLIWITKSISMIFKPNFVYLLTNERYITHTGFSSGCLGHAQGWDLGVPWWDLGVKKKCFSEIQPDLVCELLTWMAHAPAQFFVSPPPEAFGRGQKFNLWTTSCGISN